MFFGLAEEINNKKGIEKKENINYNIGHTHPGHDVGSRQRISQVDHAQINKEQRKGRLKDNNLVL